MKPFRMLSVRELSSHTRCTKPHPVLLRICAIIFIFLILAFSITQFFRPSSATHRVSEEKASWDMDPGIRIFPVQTLFVSHHAGHEAFMYAMAPSIEARVIEVLPDVYRIPEDSYTHNTYHILHLQVLDTIVGKNIPSEIYYLLPASLSTDLSCYSSLILSVRQLGLENQLMLNTTQGQLETFTPLFCAGSGTDWYYNMSLLAFTGGILDTSLWKKDGWDASDTSAEFLLTNTNKDIAILFPIRKGYPAFLAKLAIRKYYIEESDDKTPPFITGVSNSMYDWEEAQALLNYVSSFENGAFYQTYSYTDKSIQYRRVINGIVTNEIYSITPAGNDTEPSVTYAAVQFTQENLQSLPDLEQVVDTIETLRPQTENIADSWCNRLEAQYHKVGDEVFGYVTVSWGSFPDRLQTHHILLLPDDTQKTVSKTVLDAYLEYGTAGGKAAELAEATSTE